jgi:uncharacterized protein
MRQSWRDVVFLHWETDPESAQRWLPDGTHLDLHDGRAFVGLIGLRIQTALLGLVPAPHFASFDEVNVRVYSVDDQGPARDRLLLPLDAERLLTVLAARSGYRLPYMWSPSGWTATDGNSAIRCTADGPALTIPPARSRC